MNTIKEIKMELFILKRNINCVRISEKDLQIYIFINNVKIFLEFFDLETLNFVKNLILTEKYNIIIPKNDKIVVSIVKI